jgi:hypothetical protein
MVARVSKSSNHSWKPIHALGTEPKCGMRSTDTEPRTCLSEGPGKQKGETRCREVGMDEKMEQLSPTMLDPNRNCKHKDKCTSHLSLGCQVHSGQDRTNYTQPTLGNNNRKWVRVPRLLRLHKKKF